MTILKFQRHDFERHDMARGWQGSEMNSLLAACADSLANGTACNWEVGETETGEPQLYLLGPAPDHDCILCVSRLGHTYILEDGQGRVVFEHDAMSIMAAQLRSSLQHKKAAILARVLVAWLALKETFEERVEPVLSEPAEILAHVAPQFAGLA